jgi:hypothetical protein
LEIPDWANPNRATPVIKEESSSSSSEESNNDPDLIHFVDVNLSHMGGTIDNCVFSLLHLIPPSLEIHRQAPYDVKPKTEFPVFSVAFSSYQASVTYLSTVRSAQNWPESTPALEGRTVNLLELKPKKVLVTNLRAGVPPEAFIAKWIGSYPISSVDSVVAKGNQLYYLHLDPRENLEILLRQPVKVVAGQYTAWSDASQYPFRLVLRGFTGQTFHKAVAYALRKACIPYAWFWIPVTQKLLPADYAFVYFTDKKDYKLAKSLFKLGKSHLTLTRYDPSKARKQR